MTKRKPSTTAASRIRCAIYTRKSSEEGLDQSYNSLDAQRDACEAYVMSQTGEGWSAIPIHYDDGGFSGGNMDRPGLKQLLADVAAKRVDVVVVYKVDRLTRSLTDFARIVESFDAHGVSFVSVTQAFNTTSSMGRLTLNVLLSFAQFEREVTGERIRDKIAASKRRGMWMGGIPPLGYRNENRMLVPVEEEVTTLRYIFERYLTLQSVRLLREELERDGIRSPGCRGGEPSPFGRGALYHLLTNRLYLGEVVHKGEVFDGLHPAIIERTTFDAAGKLLEAHKYERRPTLGGAANAPLTGLIFDGLGQPMSPVFTRNRHGRVYRYYASAGLQTGSLSAGQGTRVGAPAVEAIILDRVSKLVGNVGTAGCWKVVKRVVIDGTTIAVHFETGTRVHEGHVTAPDQLAVQDGQAHLLVAGQVRRWRGRSEVARPDMRPTLTGVRLDPVLIKGLARAHRYVADVKQAPTKAIADIAAERGIREPYFRRLMQLSFLAPDIQQAIVDGRQPASLSLEQLMKKPIPLGWEAQRRALSCELC